MGALQQLSGVLFGRPGGPVLPARFADYDEAVLNALDESGLTDLPVVCRMDFGHTDPVFILPYGVEAEIDCDSRRFTICGNAVAEAS